MSKNYRILVINPGSTSTKIGCFDGTACVSAKSLQHKTDDLKKYRTVIDQYPFRMQALREYLEEQNLKGADFDAVVGRGGLLRPLDGGIYEVNDLMLHDLKTMKFGQHASNLGAVIAHDIAIEAGIPAYTINPIVVDELQPLARVSGLPEIPRTSVFHALNQKAVAYKAASELGKKYSELNLIVAHLGGGITIAAHRKGRAIDVNNALEEGPFTPERSGSLPVLKLVDLCFSGGYSRDEIKKKLLGKGGLAAYLDTSDARTVQQMVSSGDEKATLIFKAMAYQIAKEIGACSTVLSGRIDCIVLTGGLAHCDMLINWIKDRVRFIAPVKVYPGEDELSAMAEGVIKVLTGEERSLLYL